MHMPIAIVPVSTWLIAVLPFALIALAALAGLTIGSISLLVSGLRLRSELRRPSTVEAPVASGSDEVAPLAA